MPYAAYRKPHTEKNSAVGSDTLNTTAKFDKQGLSGTSKDVTDAAKACPGGMRVIGKIYLILQEV